jgi:hypothetical protein
MRRLAKPTRWPSTASRVVTTSTTTLGHFGRSEMPALLKILRIALLTQKTVAAVAASVVIAVGTIEYLRKHKK